MTPQSQEVVPSASHDPSIWASRFTIEDVYNYRLKFPDAIFTQEDKKGVNWRLPESNTFSEIPRLPLSQKQNKCH